MSLEPAASKSPTEGLLSPNPAPAPPPPSPHLNPPDQPGKSERSLSLTNERHELSRQLECISEDPDNPAPVKKEGKPLTLAQQKRATMVKKAIKYFEDKSNRSVSEDNLFTRRKNLAVHLGLDEKVSKKEIQKINTYSLPIPSSATSFDIPDPAPPVQTLVVVEDEDDEDVKSKNLVSFLGMKDGLTASIASQGTLSESPRGSAASVTSRAAAELQKGRKIPVAQNNEAAVAVIAKISPASLNSASKETKEGGLFKF